MRDPLSVAPVIPGGSKIPDVIGQYYQQRSALEQQRRQDDANKMATLDRLQYVEAVGWDRDQGVIEGAKQEHMENVANIMRETDGMPTDTQLRQIKRSEETIKHVAAKSVADQKEYTEWLRHLRTNMDKYDYVAAARELEEHYGKNRVIERGQFDITGFRKEKAVDPNKVFGPIGTDLVVRGDQKGTTTTETPRKLEYIESVVRQMSVGGSDQNLWLQQYLKSNPDSDVEAAASAVYDIKLAQQRLQDKFIPVKKAAGTTTAPNAVWTTATLSGDRKVEGVLLKESVSKIQVPTKDGWAGFDPRVIYVEQDPQSPDFGKTMVSGVMDFDGEKKFISLEQHQALRKTNEAEANNYAWDRMEQAYYDTRTAGKKHIPVSIEYNKIEPQLQLNIKGLKEIMEGSGSKLLQQQYEAARQGKAVPKPPPQGLTPQEASERLTFEQFLNEQ